MEQLVSNASKIPVTYQGQTYDISANRRIGSDHLLLFLHGLGCAKESFDNAFEAEELKGYSICAFDFLGFGESDKPTDFSYDLEAQAVITRQIIDYINPTKVSIVAHSMGGAIGILATERLDRLHTFVNVEGNLVAEDCGLVSRNTAKQPLVEFQDQGYKEFLDVLTSSDRHDFREWAIWYGQASPQAIHESARSMVKWSDSGKLIEIFNRLQNKVFIYGDEEPKEYLFPLFQNVTVRYIPNVKHFMMTESPKLFFTEIGKIF